jgi:hypothetical protein
MPIENIPSQIFKLLHSTETELSHEKLIELHVESEDGTQNPFLIKEYTSKAGDRKNEMVVYTPGGGGDGTLNFELNYLEHLLEQGYDVVTIRHCGLNPFKEEGRRLLNFSHEEIMESIAYGNNPGHLSYLDWSKEPAAVIEYLEQNYPELKSVKLIGHSFAGMSNRVSMVDYKKKNPDSRVSISNVVELSPANYPDGLKGADYDGWKGYFESQTSLPDTYNGFCPPSELLGQVVEVANQDKQARLRLRELYTDTNFAVVVPSGDTYVSQNVGEVLQADIPEGVVVVRQEFADRIAAYRNTRIAESTDERTRRFVAKGGNGEIHDNLQLTPQELLRLLTIKPNEKRNTTLIPNATRTDSFIGQ